MKPIYKPMLSVLCLISTLMPGGVRADEGAINPALFNFSVSLPRPVAAAEGSAGSRGGNCGNSNSQKHPTSDCTAIKANRPVPVALSDRSSGLQRIEPGKLKGVKSIRATYYVRDPGTPQKHRDHTLYPVRLEVKPKQSGIPTSWDWYGGATFRRSGSQSMIGNAFNFEGRVPGTSEYCERTGPETYGCSVFFALEGKTLYAQVSGKFGKTGNSDLFVIGEVEGSEVKFVPGIIAKPVRITHQRTDYVTLSLSIDQEPKMLFPPNLNIQSKLGASCDRDHLSARYDFVSKLREGLVWDRGTLQLEVVSRTGDRALIKVRKIYTEEVGRPSTRVIENEVEQTVEQFCPQFGLRMVQRCESADGETGKIGDLDTCEIHFKSENKTIWFAELPFSMAKFTEGGSITSTEYTYQTPGN